MSFIHLHNLRWRAFSCRAFSRSHLKKASAYCLALSLWNDFVASRSSFGDAPFALGVGRTLLTLAKPNSCTVACLLLDIFAMVSEPWSRRMLKLCISAILGSRQDCERSRMCMHRTTRGARRPTCTTPAENVVILRAGLGRGLMDFARGGKSPDEGSYFALIDLFAPAFAREMKSTAPEHLTGDSCWNSKNAGKGFFLLRQYQVKKGQ